MEILPSIDDRDFTGLVHARKCRIVEEKDCLSSYDNVNHYCAPNTIIRSKADNVSLNPMMIISSSIEEDHYRTNSIETKQRVNLHEQNLIHSKQLQMTIDDDDESDGSNYSEDFRLVQFVSLFRLLPRFLDDVIDQGDSFFSFPSKIYTNNQRNRSNINHNEINGKIHPPLPSSSS